MATHSQTFVTPEAYLIKERSRAWKSEYFQGQVLAMGGASRSHVLIVTNLLTSLNSQLRARPCEVYASDMRVKVSLSGLYAYPDVVVVCGEPTFEDQGLDTLFNPGLITEVLSPSTEAYDRGLKFEQYRTVDSLTDYLVVAQDRPLVEHFVRQPNGSWLFSACNEMEDAVIIASLDCRLQVGEIYEKVSFD